MVGLWWRGRADGGGGAAEVSAGPSTITVQSDLSWQASGLEVRVGDALTLSATGRYTFHSAGHQTGPEGIADADPYLGAWPAKDLTGLALIGKIGEPGEPFLVGTRVERTVEHPGMLFLMVNDDILEENDGVLNVVAEVRPSAR